MIKRITMFLLTMILLLPVSVNALKKLVDVESLSDANNFGFRGRINSDYSDFLLAEYDYETDEFILYRYDWNKNGTILPSNFDNDNIIEYEYNDFQYLHLVNVGGASSNNRKIIMEEDSLNVGSYQYKVLYDNSTVEYVSNYIYSSSTKGESLGCILEDDMFGDLYVYELLKTAGGADYVSDTGRIVFSTVDVSDTGYTLLTNNERVNAFKNDTNIIIIYYDEGQGPSTISKFTVASLRSLLQVDDLTGIEITSNLISTAGDKYLEVKLNNYIYFINSTATEILYQKEIADNKEYEFYGINYNDKDYIFFDLYETSPYHQILTEVFDLEGNRYYEDSEWVNLYFTNYSSLFGIEKLNNKYYAEIVDLDGTKLYSKDITDRDDIGNFYYNFYGEVLTADHDTTSLNNGKYLLYFYNSIVNDNEYFHEYEIMSIISNYSVVKGANQKYALGSNKTAVFKINANNDLFDKLYINDTELDPSNYTITKGSTIITLSSEYLNTLKKGTYKLTATFTNDESVTTRFNISSSSTNPNTSDKIVNYVLFGTIAIIGLIGISLYYKKRIIINKKI